MSELKGREGMPLRAEVDGERLVVSIGVDTLAFAFEHGEENNPYNEVTGDFERRYQISWAAQFAKDVCAEMNREGEDGSTPLTRFLDGVMDEAVNQGSLGIHDPDGE
jgi:hypothetical protein